MILTICLLHNVQASTTFSRASVSDLPVNEADKESLIWATWLLHLACSFWKSLGAFSCRHMFSTLLYKCSIENDLTSLQNMTSRASSSSFHVLLKYCSGSDFVVIRKFFTISFFGPATAAAFVVRIPLDDRRLVGEPLGEGLLGLVRSMMFEVNLYMLSFANICGFDGVDGAARWSCLFCFLFGDGLSGDCREL